MNTLLSEPEHIRVRVCVDPGVSGTKHIGVRVCLALALCVFGSGSGSHISCMQVWLGTWDVCIWIS